MVAEYLEQSGFNISKLAAWDNECKADIVCKYKDKELFYEVKFLPDSPEFEELRLNAVKNNNSPAAAMPSPKETWNYYFYRLAEAVLQLKSKKIDIDNRNIFFVFSESASGRSGRGLFEESIKNGYCEWYKDERGFIEGLKDIDNDTEEKRDKKMSILAENKFYWFKETGKLYLATMKNYKLENVKQYSPVAG